MASVRRSQRREKSGRKYSRGSSRTAGSIELPTSMTQAGGDINDFSILIHGVKKIGKTSLALQGGKVLVVQFDPPQIAYDRMEVVCPDYSTFLLVLKELEKKAGGKKFPYDRIVIDRCDTWYQHAMNYTCDKLAIDHPQDEAYGKGWNAVKKTFSDAVDRVLRLPCGKWFLCHSNHQQDEDRHGNEITKLFPNLSKQADEILNGKVDAWFAYVYEGRSRALVVNGDERTGAGHRINKHFRTVNDEPIEMISMGRNEEEGFENLLAGFNNEQKKANPFAEEGVRVKKKKKIKRRSK